MIALLRFLRATLFPTPAERAERLLDRMENQP